MDLSQTITTRQDIKLCQVLPFMFLAIQTFYVLPNIHLNILKLNLHFAIQLRKKTRKATYAFINSSFGTDIKQELFSNFRSYVLVRYKGRTCHNYPATMKCCDNSKIALVTVGLQILVNNHLRKELMFLAVSRPTERYCQILFQSKRNNLTIMP